MIPPAAFVKKFDVKLAKSTLNFTANLAYLEWIFLTNQQVSNMPNSPLDSFCLTHWGRGTMATIFQCIFLTENVWIPITISLKFVPTGPINNIPALV